MYCIHITFTDGTWRLDRYTDVSTWAEFCHHEALEVSKGRTKVFAAYRES